MRRMLSIAIVCLLLASLAPITLFAHEMYPSLRWHNVSYSYAYGHNVLNMKVNGDFLNSTYKGYVSTARDKWNNHSNNYVSIQLTSISSSDVDMANYGFTWPSEWGNDSAGYTLVFDGSGNEYKDGNFSGTKISYSQIYTNPAYDTAIYNSAKEVNLLVHELGHSMNLGHPPSNTASVMRTPVDFYDTPQNHDRNDLAAYY